MALRVGGLLMLLLAPAYAGTTECGGDCDGDGEVTIGELVTAVGVALGHSPTASCLRADINSNGTVEINEIIGAVGNALGDCAASPTATPLALRYVDNADGTVTDRGTDLMWQKQDWSGGLRDVTLRVSWSGYCTEDFEDCQPDEAATNTCRAAIGRLIECNGCLGAGTCETGQRTTIWQWLNALNASRFAGYSDWRIPTADELETLWVVARVCEEGVPHTPVVFIAPCEEGCAGATCSCTSADSYWSATALGDDRALQLYFGGCSGVPTPSFEAALVRAVRAAGP